MNDYSVRGMYPEMQYANMPKTPFLISVPGISQQQIIKKQLPEISEMLLDGGVIREPLSFIERKGRESYACARRAGTILEESGTKTGAKGLTNT